MTIGNMHKKFDEDQTWNSRDNCSWTEKHTDSRHNTLPPLLGQSHYAGVFV